MSDDVFFNKMVTKGLEPIESDGRFFEGFLTVQVKDKQGEVTIVDELYKVLPIWMDRGAPITDTHSNRVVGKGINFARSDYTDADGTIYPAIKVTGKIYKDYELDNEIWKKIKSGEYKGLSFGGSTKTDRQPMRMKDGSIAYSLSKLEHYEVAVCRDPAVPLAVITDTNPIAKSNMNCDNTGCYVTKPILGAPDFESAKRKVMRESDVPEKNAEKIVGAAEAGHLGKGNPNLPYNEEYFKKDVCNDCGLPKKVEKREIGHKTNPSYSFNAEAGEADLVEQLGLHGLTPMRARSMIDEIERRYKDRTRAENAKKIEAEEQVEAATSDANKTKGKQVKERKKRKRQSQGIGNKRGWGAYKSKKIKFPESITGDKKFDAWLKTLDGVQLMHVNDEMKKMIKEQNKKYREEGASPEQQARITTGMERTFKALMATNKILGKYQGNVLKLSRILDKAKKKRDLMDTRGDKHHDDCPFCKLQQLGIKEGDIGSTDLQNIHTNYPREYHRLLSGHNEVFNPKFRKQIQDKKITEGMTSTFGKSFTAIQAKIKDITRDMEVYEPLGGKETDEDILSFIRPKRQAGRPRKKKLTKVGSGAMVDPNTSNQGAAFNIRTQTPPKRKMQAKLGDGTYDYSN